MQYSKICSVKYCIFSTIGNGLIICGTVFALFCQEIFDSFKNEELKLKPNSMVFESWRVLPIPLKLDVYLFNWTNPEDFTNHSTKPILKELGPYRFTEKRENVDITWNLENFTISYRTKSVYYFDATGSVGSLDDVVTILDLVSVAMSARAKNCFWFSCPTLMNLHVTKTAAELLFDGYTDLANSAAHFFNEAPSDRIGFLYDRNNTAKLSPYYNVNTGMDDIKKLGILRAFNFQNQTEFFKGDCGVVNGSAGEFHPQRLTHQSTLSLFTPTLCRSVPFDFSEEIDIHGIKAYKYVCGDKAVDNGAKYPKNACYSLGEKLPVGVFNISACRDNAPFFMSFPHFYKGDQFYLDQVEGLRPNKSKHESYYDIEPKMGVPLNLVVRFQLNVRVEPNDGISRFREVPTILMPVMWLENSIRSDESMLNEIKFGLFIPMLGFICCGIIIFIGILLVICKPLYTIWQSCSSPPSLNSHKSTENFEVNRINDKSALKSEESALLMHKQAT